MEYEKALEIIEYEFDNSRDFDEIEFDFFGGEPFIEFPLMKKIVENVEKNNFHKPYCFFATTNGTLVQGEIIDWLRERNNFYCGLSYDGTPEMQDANRSGSSSLIDLDFFIKQYPTQDIKMTISTDTLESLYDGVVYLEDKGFSVSCNLAYGIDWSDRKYADVLESELSKLIKRYLNDPALTPSRILKSNIDQLAAIQQDIKPYCGAGTAMVAYDVDGLSYPCQFFMPISCGEEKARNADKIDFPTSFIPPDLIEEKCQNCVVRNVCPTCYGSNYSEFGNIYQQNDNYCALTKIIMRARSYLRAKQWELGQLDLSTDEEKLLLKSIYLIQTKLNT